MSVLTNPNSRVVINVGERPVSADINQLQSDLQDTQMAAAAALLAASSAIASGTSATPSFENAGAFLADGFFVDAISPTPALSVTVRPGLGYISNPSDKPQNLQPPLVGTQTNGVDDVAPLKPMPLSAQQTFAVPTPDTVHGRYDIIEATYYRRFEQQQSRDIINPLAGTVTANLVDKVLAYYLDDQLGTVVTPAASTAGISYKQGVAAASPVPPPGTPGYVTLATIFVPANATAIQQSNIIDVRPLSFPSGLSRVSGAFTVTTPDGVNVTGMTGYIQAPPGVRAAALCHANLVANGVKIFVLAGGSGDASAPQAARALVNAEYVKTINEALPGTDSLSSAQFGKLGMPANGDASYTFLMSGNSSVGAGSDSSHHAYPWVAPFAGTIAGLFAYITAADTAYTIGQVVPYAGGVGGQCAVEVWKSTDGGNTFAATAFNGFGAGCAVFSTGLGSGIAQDVTHSATFNAGDWIQLRCVPNGSATFFADVFLGANLKIQAAPGTIPVQVNDSAFGSVPSGTLGSTDAGDLQNIGVSPIGLPGPVAATIGQPAYRISLPIITSGASGTFTYHFDLALTAGAEV